MGHSARAFFWFTAGVFLVVLLPRLAQDGMFMDGELYAAVAHNEALGYGTFWQPRFSAVGLAGMTTFHEHPPLFFGLLATWFKVFGSGFWVERLFALCMAMLVAWCIMGIWRSLLPFEPGRRTAWWPVLLWIIIPTVFWSIHNNMMENTMAVFTTAAVWCVIQAWGRGRSWIVVAGVLVLLAALTKGLPGLFPLAAPLLFSLVLDRGRIKRGILDALLMSAIVVGGLALLWYLPESNANLRPYVEKRLLHRIAEVPTVDHRFASLEMLATNLLGPLALAALVWWIGGGRAVPGDPDRRRRSLALLLVGLAGVLPLMLTMVQKSFYMGAALPIMALAVALPVHGHVAALVDRVAFKPLILRVIRGAGIVLVMGALMGAILLFGTPGRDAELLSDVHRIGQVVPPGTKVGLPNSMWDDWSLQTYLMRYHSISLDAAVAQHPWYITGRDEAPPLPEAYHALDIGLQRTALWALGDAR